jgi:hypothetical protein
MVGSGVVALALLELFVWDIKKRINNYFIHLSMPTDLQISYALPTSKVRLGIASASFSLLRIR